MKKHELTCIITILFLMILSSFACASGLDESPLYGTYMKATEYSEGNYSIELFHLFPDHTGYYLSEWISGGKFDGAHEEMVTWMFAKGAKVQISLERGILEFSMGNYGQLKDGDGFIYTKVYPRRDWN